MTAGRTRRAVAGLAPYLTLAVLVVAFAIAIPRFATADNLGNQARRAALYALPAVGMSFVIALGMIDLSVGSTIALSGVVAAASIERFGASPAGELAAGIAGALAAGLACGVVNGLLSTKLKIPSFIATLGTLGIYRGIAQYSTGGVSISAPALRPLDGGIAGAPLVVLAGLAAFAAGAVLLHRARFGRHTLAIGGNRQAAKLCGVPVDRHVVAVYAFAGILWGLTALFFSGLGGSGNPNEAEGLELDVIAAVVIGGGSLAGGVGTVAGAVAGTVTIVLLRNACVLGGVEPLLQKVLIGAVLIAAVAIDEARRRRRRA